MIRGHSLSARKSLGQNFILDLNLTGRIAREGGAPTAATIIEVGPGPGGLTRALLSESAASVVVIERDARCLPALNQISQAFPGRLQIIHGDAMQVDMAALAASGPTRLIANLPYNIATGLLTGWVASSAWPPWWDGLALMFQREVAERIVAAPGSKAYGRLAVLCQWRCTCSIAMTLPPQAFTPPPKVDSAVIVLEPRPAPAPPCDLSALERVTAAAFGQRRKMLRASLKGVFSDPEAVLGKAGIAPTARAETLEVADFARLADMVDSQP